MSTGDVYYAKWKFQDVSAGTTMTPGIHVRQDGVGFDADTLAEYMRDAWNQDGGDGVMASLYDDDIVLEAILIRRIEPIEPVEQEKTTGLPSAGTGSGDTLPGQDAVLVSWRTANIGRSYRGRTYFPPVLESQSGAYGYLSDAAAQNVATNMSNLASRLAGGGGPQLPIVVWSPKLSIATQVSGVKVDKRIRSQRRRQIHTAVYVDG